VDAGRDLTPRFQLFLAPALLLLLIDTWLAGRTRRRASPARGAASDAAGSDAGNSAPSAARGGPGRAAALATLVAGAAGLAGCARLDLAGRDRDPALDAFSRGDARAALAVYRDRTRAGGSPAARYNLGTALAAVDSLGEARAPLDEARRTRDPELRFRALFNLGYTHLRRGLAGAAGAATPTRAAKSGSDTTGSPRPRELDGGARGLPAAAPAPPVGPERQVELRARAASAAALRRRRRWGRRRGGGGSGGSPPMPRRCRSQTGGVDRRQAEQLLQAAAREERQTQGRQQRRSPLTAAARRQGL
jgi:hypothetical protein